MNRRKSNRLDCRVMQKIAGIDEVLKFIKQFQEEQSCTSTRTYDGFNITKNNVELLQKLRRKIKSNFSA